MSPPERAQIEPGSYRSGPVRALTAPHASKVHPSEPVIAGVQLGIDPLAFGVFVVLAIEAAQITPPIGINIFTIASIGDVDIRRISLQIAPFLALIVALMFSVIFVEPLATWLPNTM